MSKIFEIRDYRSKYGPACHRLRRAAFHGVFSGYLPKNLVHAGAESYSVADFTERIAALATFVALVDQVVVGFCSIRLLSQARAQVLYLYIGPEHRGTGFGSRLVRHAERLVLEAHPKLETICLDTAVPEYNQSFWERMGYRPVDASFCEYPGGEVPALRLEKRMERMGAMDMEG